MQTFNQITSRVMPLPINNIDTDQIIPARYLKVIDKKSVAAGLFADWRYLPDGNPNPEFVINNPLYTGAQILLVENNFGCGSSREHAPWALTGCGIRCVISTGFADIFNNNALKNGLLPLTITETQLIQLLTKVQEDPFTQVTINLQDQTVSINVEWAFSFEINAFAKKCLLNGNDQLDYILHFEEEIIQFEHRRIQ
jgi:3-isopropylmalate/(R)-2-methylmalate dehydratase small subunit